MTEHKMSPLTSQIDDLYRLALERNMDAAVEWLDEHFWATRQATVIEVPREALSAAWVAAVANLNHPYGTCNPGFPERCFVCEALAALQPYHHPGSEP